MKKLFIIMIALAINSGVISCTPQNISEQHPKSQDCCGEESTIPPPKPPPPGGTSGT